MDDQSCLFNATFKDQDWIFDDQSQRTLVAVMLVFLCIGGVCGNAWIIVSAVLSKELKTSTHAFVVSLAVADLLSALLLPFSIRSFLFTNEGLPFHCILCKVLGSAATCTYSAVMVNIAVIAFNRFFRITKPLARYYRYFNKRTIPIILAFPWICGVIVPIVFTFLKTLTFGFNHKYKICLIHFPTQKITAPSILRFALIDIFCIVVTVVCYAKIYLYTLHINEELRKFYYMISFNMENDNKTTDGKTSNSDDEETQSSVLPGSYLKTQCSSEDYLEYCIDELQINSHARHENVDAGETDAQNNIKPKSQNLKLTGVRRHRSSRNIYQSLSKRERTLTKNIFLVTCSILLCTIPYLACLSIEKLERIFPYVTVFYISKCCINPLIYALRDPRFRISPWQRQSTS